MATYLKSRFAVTDGSIPSFVEAAGPSEALSKVTSTKGLKHWPKHGRDGLSPTWYVFPVFPDQEDLIRSLSYAELMDLIAGRQDVDCYL